MADMRSVSWWELLERELGGAHLTELLAFVDAMGDGDLPPRSDVFRALELTPPGETKAVIVGQDPYRRREQAHGLCFSVRSGFKPLPASLRVILRELERDGFHASDNGNLEPWARQGVLLLNTALTVQEGKSGSHLARWRRFTDAVIRIAAGEPARVFLLWGAHAQKKNRSSWRQGAPTPTSSGRLIRPRQPAIAPAVKAPPSSRAGRSATRTSC